MLGCIAPTTLTNGMGMMIGSARLLRSTDVELLLHALNQNCLSAPLPLLYWFIARAHPDSSSLAFSTPRGLGSSMVARASTVASSTTVRPIVGSSGGSGRGTPPCLDSRFAASHRLYSASYSAYFSLYFFFSAACILHAGAVAALAAGVFFDPGGDTVAMKTVALSCHPGFNCNTRLAPIPALRVARTGTATRSGGQPIAAAASPTNLLGSAGSASTGKAVAAGSSPEIGVDGVVCVVVRSSLPVRPG